MTIPGHRATALVVNGELAAAASVAKILAANHFDVTVANSFENARRRIDERAPQLLVTELSFGDHNGLHLVSRGKSRRPGMGAIVLSNRADDKRQTEVEQAGATFVALPVEHADLVAAALRTLMRSISGHGEASEPIRPPFERRKAQRRLREVPRLSDRRASDRRRDLRLLLSVVADD